MAKKKCTQCNKEKLLEEFVVCRRNSDGRKSACKECEKDMRARHDENFYAQFIMPWYYKDFVINRVHVKS